MEKLHREAAAHTDFIGWVILNGITNKSGAIEEIAKTSGDLEIEFRVNGVDLPFVETVREIEAQIERMIHEKAVELLREKTGRAFDELSDSVEAATRKLKRDLGVTDED